MKFRVTIFFVIVVGFLDLDLKAQTSDFAPVGAVWKYWNYQEYFYPNDYMFSYLHVTHDTIIGGFPCRGVSSSPKSYQGQHIPSNRSILYLRNSKDTVFVNYVNGNDSVWHFLYDFGAKPGDFWGIRSPDPQSASNDVYFQTPMEVVDTGTTSVIGDSKKFIALTNSSNCSSFSTSDHSCGIFGWHQSIGNYPNNDDYYHRSTVLETIGGFAYLFLFQNRYFIHEYSCSFSCGLACYVERNTGYTFSTSPGEFDCELLLNRPHQLQELNPSFTQNPSQETITIAIKGNPKTNSLRVVDMLGRTVHTAQTHEQETTISTADWAPGVYVLQVADDSGRSYSRKFVVQ